MRGGALGDFVLTLPAISALRLAHPEARLVLLAHPQYAPLAGADDVCDIGSAELAPLFAEDATPGTRLRSLLGGIDLMLAYSTDTTGALPSNLARLVSGRVVVADPRPDAAEHRHQALHLAAPLAALGVPVRSLVPRVRLAANPALRRARRTRDTALPAGPRPRVLLHPGSGGRRKRWPVACFAALATGLRQRGLAVEVVCGPAETDLELSWAEPVARPASPLELAMVLQSADLVVAGDCGPAHLAAAVGTRTLALFGPTEPSIWRPLAPWALALRAPTGVLADLPVDCVLEAAQELLWSPHPGLVSDDA